MKKKSKITIITQQTESDDSSRMELTTQGFYWQENDRTFIQYNETKATGFEGSITTLTIENGTVYIKRNGEFSSGLVLETKKEHYGHYFTPMGSFDITTKTYRIKNELKENGGHLFLQYGVYANGMFLSQTKLLLTVKAEPEQTPETNEVKTILKEENI